MKFPFRLPLYPEILKFSHLHILIFIQRIIEVYPTFVDENEPFTDFMLFLSTELYLC